MAENSSDIWKTDKELQLWMNLQKEIYRDNPTHEGIEKAIAELKKFALAKEEEEEAMEKKADKGNEGSGSETNEKTSQHSDH